MKLRFVSVLVLAAGIADAAPARRARPAAEWCRPPAGWRFDLDEQPQLRRGGKLVPIASPTPTPQSADLAACKAALQRKGFCLYQDLAIISAGNVAPSAPCTDDPPGTKAFYVGYDNFIDYFDRLGNQPEIKDRYHNYVFFTNFQSVPGEAPASGTQECGTIAWHQVFAGKVSGIGAPYKPATQQLYAFTNMLWSQKWAIDEWTSEDDVAPIPVLAHETEHDVCCYVRFYDKTSGKQSTALIGQQGAHWSLYHNTYGQLMYGANWREEGNGTFFSIGPAEGARPLDLYVWGLIPPERVPPVYLVDTSDKAACKPKPQTLAGLEKDCATMDIGNGKKCQDDKTACLAKFDLCVDPPYARGLSGECVPYGKESLHAPQNLTATGKKKVVAVDDIIKIHGKRSPDWKDSQKVTTHLYVLLVGGGVELEQALVDRLALFRRQMARYMYRETEHRLRTLNSIDGVDDSALWEWGGEAEWKGDDELEGWKGEGVKTPLAVSAGQLVVELADASSRIANAGVRIDGRLYDAYQVVMTVPPVAGLPKLVYGKLVLKNASETRELRFPILADGRKHTVTVHPPHALVRAEACKGCLPVCKNAGKPDEGWYSSCTGALVKAGACKTKEGQSACGPYCTSGAGDPSLEASAPEGWYDSCESQLKGVYDSVALYPVAGPEAGQLGAPVRVDRVDFFRVAEVKKLEETRRHDGEKDYDGDGLVNAYDNCPTLANPDQRDSNADGRGDACGDFDSDGVVDALDNCPTVVNSLQQDDDKNGVGNACDPGYSRGGCAVAIGGAARGAPALLLALALAIVVLGRSAPRARLRFPRHRGFLRRAASARRRRR